MIIVTGAAGFIGSRLIARLNKEKYNAIIAVDDFSNPLKNKNLEDLNILQKVNRKNFFRWIDENEREIEFIFHLGARTDTTEFNLQLLTELNTDYSREVWKRCTEYQIPLVYASSAATYGLGEYGYSDSELIIPKLNPLNPYGVSKNNFDLWVTKQQSGPFFWTGLKFFNVYGPHEDHKGRMASVVFHTYKQIKASGKMKLFRSHNPEFGDGEQKRDFIYVNDVTDVCFYLLHHRNYSGIYNVGTGKARTFLDLANSVFNALNITPQIEFIDTPEDIRDKYQYFTRAEMNKLRSIGYGKAFTDIEKGVEDYVKNYLEISS